MTQSSETLSLQIAENCLIRETAPGRTGGISRRARSAGTEPVGRGGEMTFDGGARARHVGRPGRGGVTLRLAAAFAGVALAVAAGMSGPGGGQAAARAAPSGPEGAERPATDACPAPQGVLWGVNGHPLTAYPGILFESQVETVRRLGLRGYRVNVSSEAQAPALARLMAMAARSCIQVLPVLTPPLSLERESPAQLYASARAFARKVVSPLRGRASVWELGNELENYAIMRAGDVKDDGAPYNPNWGPAGGLAAGDYATPRWVKVSAVLHGLSDGVAEADPRARRAIGTAGWSHLGAFERIRSDRIAWEISVWHVYGDDPEEPFRRLARFGKPIWVTEFSAAQESGALDQAQRAEQVTRMMQRLTALAPAYHLEAAFLYELFDEPYWGDTIESRFGMVGLERRGAAWGIGRPNEIYAAVQKFTGGRGPPP